MYRNIILAFVLFSLPCDAETEQLPLWQIGLGGGLIGIPDYRGSGQKHVYPYPFLFPMYNGTRLKVDQDGIEALLLQSDRFKFDFSLDGGVPVSGDDNARVDMPKLGPTVQIGPMIKYRAWKNNTYDQSLVFKLPIRYAFSIDSGLNRTGYTAFPHVTYRRKVLFQEDRWKLGLSGGLLFGSEKYHAYYYQVLPEYSTEGRPEYDANGGYGGTRFIATFHRRDPKKLISIYALYDGVNNAVFEDSPLVESTGGVTVGFVVAWFVSQSRSLVEVKNWELD
jgi:outer membrane scaffolding protein for murein synthesis (MipA/OmpV family)